MLSIQPNIDETKKTNDEIDLLINKLVPELDFIYQGVVEGGEIWEANAPMYTVSVHFRRGLCGDGYEISIHPGIGKFPNNWFHRWSCTEPFISKEAAFNRARSLVAGLLVVLMPHKKTEDTNDEH